MSHVRPLLPLLMAAALLLSGNGLSATVITLRGIAEGFAPSIIGLLLSGYFVGFIFGCRYGPKFIAEVGHIRAFTAFASLASASALAHAMVVEPAMWLVLRVITGFSFAAIQMIVESWLNESATNKSRGRILSVYRITDFMSVTAAQAAIGLVDVTHFLPFAIISVMLSVALVPVALAPVVAPAPPATAKLNIRRLWTVSPSAAAASFCVGLAASAYWSMGPVFVTDLGYESGVVGLFIAAIIFGGAIAQWPAGALSDRIDRRQVMLICSAGAAAAALFLSAFGGASILSLLGGALLFGAFALPTFGLGVAHANDVAEPGTSVAVNGGLLMLYGVAAVGGAILAPAIMAAYGTRSLFVWVMSVHLSLAVFNAIRLFARPAPASEDKEPYVAVPRTSPAVFELSPAGDSEVPAETAGTPGAAPAAPQPGA